MTLTYLGNPKTLSDKELKDLINSDVIGKSSLVAEFLRRQKANKSN